MLQPKSTPSPPAAVCIKAGELELALDVFQQLLREGCTPNLVTYNILIDVRIHKPLDCMLKPWCAGCAPLACAGALLSGLQLRHPPERSS